MDGFVGDRPMLLDMVCANEEVRDVVVSFANTPLQAAQVPLAMAKMSHDFAVVGGGGGGGGLFAFFLCLGFRGVEFGGWKG